MWESFEEAIFVELVEEVLKSSLWPKVKQDGRLAHRKADGIKKHVVAFVRGHPLVRSLRTLADTSL